MSNLHIGLAILGGIVLAGLVAHGAWVARKSAPRQAVPESADHPSTIGPQEPILSEYGGDSPSIFSQYGPRRLGLNPLIDAIARISLESNTVYVTGDAALAALPSTRRVGSKPLSIEGLEVRSQLWEVPVAGSRYLAFQAGVQLANRSGALNEIEYSEFVAKVQVFADAMGAMVEFPDMLDAVARARELDQFAATHDAQLGFTLRARDVSWSPGYVQQSAAHMGFVPGAIPGRMVLASQGEHPASMLILSYDPQAALAEDPTHTSIRSLTLHLDVAHVDRLLNPFERLREVSAALEQQMDGVITDDNGQRLTAGAMDHIGTELQGLYDRLEQRELAAGSPVARRLFS